MGTKNIPGMFDCHNEAEDDEPLFTLLSRDEIAPHLVKLWADIRSGSPLKAVATFAELMTSGATEHYIIEPTNSEKVDEARKCAAQMQEWFDNN